MDSAREDVWSYAPQDLLNQDAEEEGAPLGPQKEATVTEIVKERPYSTTAAEMISWALVCYRDDQEVFLSSTMAYDVEEVRLTYFNFEFKQVREGGPGQAHSPGGGPGVPVSSTHTDRSRSTQ